MAGSNKRIQRSTNRFAEVPKASVSRSTFNRSHGVKTTFDAGKLVPVLVDDVLPGDTYTLKLNSFARLATPLHPTMDNLYLDFHAFFVPHRLVWTNFEKFMGAQENPGDSTDFTIPKLSGLASVPELSNGDYMGLPLNASSASNYQISALPFRSLMLIWNEWFRDQNLQASKPFQKDDGPDPYANYQDLLPRNKRHDYFTSGLPFPQKGDPVSIPLSGDAPVKGLGMISQAYGNPGVSVWETDATTTTVYTDAQNATLDAGPNALYVEGTDPTTGVPQIYADLAAVSGTTINELRQSFQIQKLLERDARGGTRLTEVIKAHFNVTNPDFRLQRPELLCAHSSFIQVNPVAQTSPTATDVFTSNTPQGNLAAVGTGSMSGKGFHKSFTEHGYIIGLVSARADLTYQQGINRHWTRITRFDLFWPALQHLGEQQIYNHEIFVDNTPTDVEAFAFQERYAEYRYKPSMITGQFRSQAATPLDSWHYAQDFATRPALNDDFIQENPPIDRTIAVPSEPHFLLDAYFDLRCARPMPVYGVPGLIDHF